jgi:hypothetical protein
MIGCKLDSCRLTDFVLACGSELANLGDDGARFATQRASSFAVVSVAKSKTRPC